MDSSKLDYYGSIRYPKLDSYQGLQIATIRLFDSLKTIQTRKCIDNIALIRWCHFCFKWWALTEVWYCSLPECNWNNKRAPWTVSRCANLFWRRETGVLLDCLHREHIENVPLCALQDLYYPEGFQIFNELHFYVDDKIINAENLGNIIGTLQFLACRARLDIMMSKV